MQYRRIQKSCTLYGVTNGAVVSKLATDLEVFLPNNNIIAQRFQIVEDDFAIPTKGIIGRDFLIKNKCQINYEEWMLTINGGKIRTSGFTEDKKLIFPAWAEVVKKVKLKNNFLNSFVESQEVAPGVYSQRTLVNGTVAFIRFINTNTQDITIPECTLQNENLDNYNLFGIETQDVKRKDKISALLTPNMPKFIKDKLLDLCQEYSDIFALKTDKLTHNNFYQQKLKATDDIPVYIKNYRTPNVHKQEIRRQVRELEANDIVEPSTSPHNSPLLLVPKKSTDGEKKWRLVVDFRQINRKLVPDRFPLPRIDDILDQLGRAKFFSVLDLMSGFHQIPLDEDSRDLTSFSTDSGSYRFKRLPFGLSVSPNSFQRMMNIAFAGLTPEKTFLYMDDLIVIGCSEDHHLQNLRQVFETCRKYCLKLNPHKSQFFRKEVTFLGHKITDKGILPDESKYDTIKKYPRPSDGDGVKRFIAFCNYYRRFIKNFAELAVPLNKLTKKNTKFEWSTDCEYSFKAFKEALIRPPILQYPCFDKQFIITTDASKLACDAVLSQEHGGMELPIAYASKGFTKGEINKSTIEKELAAIHWAIMYFRPYIYGHQFKVKSDHRPLVYLFSMKNPSSKLTRMRLDLEEFDFHIEYIKGSENVGADALSRIDINDLKQMKEENAAIFMVQTRSTKQTGRNEKKEESSIGNVNVYNALNREDTVGIPKLYFMRKKEIFIDVIRSKNKLLYVQVGITKDKFVLEQILSRLEKWAGDNNVTQLQMQENDHIVQEVSLNQFKEIGCKVLKKLTIIISKPTEKIERNKMKKEIIERFHRDPLMGGHCGIKRTLMKIQAYYTWKNMKKDIAKYVRSCHKCQVCKGKAKPNEPFTITQSPLQTCNN